MSDVKYQHLPTIKTNGFSYIGRKKCGCAVAIVADCEDKFTARSVAEFIRDGLNVDRVPHSAAAELLKPCKCAPASRQGSLL